MKGDNLLKEVESIVSEYRVGEVSDGGRARPGDNGNEEDTEDDGTLDAVHHQHDRKETTAEDSDPHGWIPHLLAVRTCAQHLIYELRCATSQL